MIEIRSFEGSLPGPHVFFMAGIHGNEIAGIQALKNLINRIETGQRKIKSGQLSIIACCNPAAYLNNVRQIDINLNRVFEPHISPTLYEHYLANELTSLIDNCDVLIDFHTVTATSEPFCFLDHPTHENIHLVTVAGVSHVVTGWPELVNPDGSVSTQDYAHRLGKAALTIECGQHVDPQSVQNAQLYADRILQGLDMLDNCPATFHVKQIYHHLTTFTVKSEGLSLDKDFKNFDAIKKGQILAQSHDCKIIASHDGTIVMPNNHAAVGEEIFYTATNAISS